MTWLQEIDVRPHDEDTPMEKSSRDFINSMRPFKDSSVQFRAYLPPPPNLVDQYAPMVVALLAIGFLVVQ